MASGKPALAHVIGCPAGVAPELSARMLADSEINAGARIIAIGDARILAYGAKVAGVTLNIPVIGEHDPIPAGDGPVLIDMKRLDAATLEVSDIHAGDGGRAT